MTNDAIKKMCCKFESGYGYGLGKRADIRCSETVLVLEGVDNEAENAGGQK